MEPQSIFNIAVRLSGALGGFMLKLIWDAIKGLQATETSMASDLTALRVLVAGNSVSRVEYRDDMANVMDSLKRIANKLDGTAEKN